jgi:hypothetical protein
MTHTPLLADPRLVLEPDREALVLMCRCNVRQDRRGSF